MEEQRSRSSSASSTSADNQLTDIDVDDSTGNKLERAAKVPQHKSARCFSAADRRLGLRTGRKRNMKIQYYVPKDGLVNKGHRKLRYSSVDRRRSRPNGSSGLSPKRAKSITVLRAPSPRAYVPRRRVVYEDEEEEETDEGGDEGERGELGSGEEVEEVEGEGYDDDEEEEETDSDDPPDNEARPAVRYDTDTDTDNDNVTPEPDALPEVEAQIHGPEEASSSDESTTSDESSSTNDALARSPSPIVPGARARVSYGQRSNDGSSRLLRMRQPFAQYLQRQARDGYWARFNKGQTNGWVFINSTPRNYSLYSYNMPFKRSTPEPGHGSANYDTTLSSEYYKNPVRRLPELNQTFPQRHRDRAKQNRSNNQGQPGAVAADDEGDGDDNTDDSDTDDNNNNNNNNNNSSSSEKTDTGTQENVLTGEGNCNNSAPINNDKDDDGNITGHVTETSHAYSRATVDNKANTDSVTHDITGASASTGAVAAVAAANVPTNDDVTQYDDMTNEDLIKVYNDLFNEYESNDATIIAGDKKGQEEYDKLVEYYMLENEKLHELESQTIKRLGEAKMFTKMWEDDYMKVRVESKSAQISADIVQADNQDLMAQTKYMAVREMALNACLKLSDREIQNEMTEMREVTELMKGKNALAINTVRRLQENVDRELTETARNGLSIELTWPVTEIDKVCPWPGDVDYFRLDEYPLPDTGPERCPFLSSSHNDLAPSSGITNTPKFDGSIPLPANIKSDILPRTTVPLPVSMPVCSTPMSPSNKSSNLRPDIPRLRLECSTPKPTCIKTKSCQPTSDIIENNPDGKDIQDVDKRPVPRLGPIMPNISADERLALPQEHLDKPETKPNLQLDKQAAMAKKLQGMSLDLLPNPFNLPVKRFDSTVSPPPKHSDNEIILTLKDAEKSVGLNTKCNDDSVNQTSKEVGNTVDMSQRDMDTIVSRPANYIDNAVSKSTKDTDNAVSNSAKEMDNIVSNPTKDMNNAVSKPVKDIASAMRKPAKDTDNTESKSANNIGNEVIKPTKNLNHAAIKHVEDVDSTVSKPGNDKDNAVRKPVNGIKNTESGPGKDVDSAVIMPVKDMADAVCKPAKDIENEMRTYMDNAAVKPAKDIDNALALPPNEVNNTISMPQNDMENVVGPVPKSMGNALCLPGKDMDNALSKPTQYIDKAVNLLTKFKIKAIRMFKKDEDNTVLPSKDMDIAANASTKEIDDDFEEELLKLSDDYLDGNNKPRKKRLVKYIPYTENLTLQSDLVIEAILEDEFANIFECRLETPILDISSIRCPSAILSPMWHDIDVCISPGNQEQIMRSKAEEICSKQSRQVISPMAVSVDLSTSTTSTVKPDVASSTERTLVETQSPVFSKGTFGRTVVQATRLLQPNFYFRAKQTSDTALLGRIDRALPLKSMSVLHCLLDRKEQAVSTLHWLRCCRGRKMTKSMIPAPEFKVPLGAMRYAERETVLPDRPNTLVHCDDYTRDSFLPEREQGDTYEQNDDYIPEQILPNIYKMDTIVEEEQTNTMNISAREMMRDFSTDMKVEYNSVDIQTNYTRDIPGKKRKRKEIKSKINTGLSAVTRKLPHINKVKTIVQEEQTNNIDMSARRVADFSKDMNVKCNMVDIQTENTRGMPGKKRKRKEIKSKINTGLSTVTRKLPQINKGNTIVQEEQTNKMNESSRKVMPDFSSNMEIKCNMVDIQTNETRDIPGKKRKKIKSKINTGLCAVTRKLPPRKTLEPIQNAPVPPLDLSVQESVQIPRLNLSKESTFLKKTKKDTRSRIDTGLSTRHRTLRPLAKKAGDGSDCSFPSARTKLPPIALSPEAPCLTRQTPINVHNKPGTPGRGDKLPPIVSCPGSPVRCGQHPARSGLTPLPAIGQIAAHIHDGHDYMETNKDNDFQFELLRNDYY